MVRQISEFDPLNSNYVSKYANLLLEDGRGNIDQAREVYERALRYNSAQVDLWQSYLNLCTQHCAADNNLVRGIFERAVTAVGSHMKGAQIWLDYIDYETSNLNMGFVNVICYSAA